MEISGTFSNFHFELDLDVEAPPPPFPASMRCVACDVIVLSGPHICEAGVLPAPTFEISSTLVLDADVYERWLSPPE